jgi:hypothetical protein
MTTTRIARPWWRLVVAGGLAAGVAAGVSAAGSVAGAVPHPVPAASKKLVGTFRITAGKAHGKRVSGSYFRMITPAGGYLANANSNVDGGSYTLLRPGTDKGLETGHYQPEPSPAFDKKGDSLAKRIFTPLTFMGTRFGESTARIDPQTKTKVPAPSVTCTVTS